MRMTRRAFLRGLCAVAASAAMPPLVKRAAIALIARSGYIYVGSGGSDSADGNTWETRIQTLGEAVASAQPGSTIIVGPGVYREYITLD